MILFRLLSLFFAFTGTKLCYPLNVAEAAQCTTFSGATIGMSQIATLFNISEAQQCCDACTSNDHCVAWTWHQPPISTCFLKDNRLPTGRVVDKKNHTCSGLRSGPLPSGFACVPPMDNFPFCDVTKSVKDRVLDLVGRIPDADKANLLTARGLGGDGQHMQALPTLGVPAYYWGTNCLHSLNGGSCVRNSNNETRCPTNFPSGPSFGATFDRDLIRDMAGVIGQELRAMFHLRKGHNSLDCWGPVINLNRDPRWGRNGEGGLEDAYAMGELATAWTQGFQHPRASLNANRSEPLLQGVITLKHMAANSLENTFPFTRHTFDANSTYGVSPYVMADYYLKPFRAAIKNGKARGVMCSYNAVLGVPTCLSPVIAGARDQWGFEGYVTSDSDSVNDATSGHHYTDTPVEASAIAISTGQCDIDSGDTYNKNLMAAVNGRVHGVSMADVDRALFNTFKQRFDLGLFDPIDSYSWPGADDVGTDASAALSHTASQEGLVLLRNDASLLPLTAGQRIAVVGPHANATKVLMQPYPFTPFCPDSSYDCLVTPTQAIASINDINANAWTRMAAGCDLFNTSEHGFEEALALARTADVVVLGLGIETCGMDPAHNLNPGARRPGACFQEKMTTGYVFPDEYLELEAHDRTTIALPPVQLSFARQILALGKPTVVFLMNAGAVALDDLTALPATAPVAIVEAFYPGPHGGTALAEGLFGKHNKWGRLPYTIYPANWTAQTPMTMHDLRVAPGRTYRYYRTPTYPFGFGLSLTSWTVEAPGSDSGCLATLNTATATATCTVGITVHNTGSASGDAVLLMYKKLATQTNPSASPKKNSKGETILSPIRELIGFERVKDVGVGATATVNFNVSAAILAAVDESSGDLIALSGRFIIEFDIGTGSAASVTTLSATVSGAPVVLESFPKAY
eukprot:m.117691 g.117691  ORF g.117691 m.117691 type:complete len:917 (+) comp17191_c0_seq1:436-3186(+)